MRFLAEGPNLPDLLLKRRDAGRVVFFCGAGVSLSSGMPTFFGLTRHVVRYFDPPDGSQIMTAFRQWEENSDGPRIPLDQIFHLLQQEYGGAEVSALVTERLSTTAPDAKPTSEHTIAARISADQEGNPQIVTTNFDLLFEQAIGCTELQTYAPPALPDIRYGVPITGITYLHGRLANHPASHRPYVLSSADFGRAYLSEGWATSFVRSLLERYTVVLVGYQAEDPPVRYLLQGLNSDGPSNRSGLFAFDRGLPGEIEAKWRDRGVTSIAYPGEGDDHSSLWNSLEAWAERADDPRAWRQRIIDMARPGPRTLEPYQRGQVAHLVRTTPARLRKG